MFIMKLKTILFDNGCQEWSLFIYLFRWRKSWLQFPYSFPQQGYIGIHLGQGVLLILEKMKILVTFLMYFLAKLKIV